jgi:hypothetical protein
MGRNYSTETGIMLRPERLLTMFLQMTAMAIWELEGLGQGTTLL